VQHGARVGAVGLAVTFVAAGCAEAPQSVAAPPTGGAAATSPSAPSASFSGPEVTAQEAQTTALEAVGGGWILETKIEERDDDPDDDTGGTDWDGDDDFEPHVDVWEVTVVLPDRQRYKVSVDVTNGSVLDNRVDD
jgi:hypothetical protein